MPRLSKTGPRTANKAGKEAQRRCVEELNKDGIPAMLVPLSGAPPGFEGDIVADLRLFGFSKIQVKQRDTTQRQEIIRRWLGLRRALVLYTSDEEALAVLRWQDLRQLLAPEGPGHAAPLPAEQSATDMEEPTSLSPLAAHELTELRATLKRVIPIVLDAHDNARRLSEMNQRAAAISALDDIAEVLQAVAEKTRVYRRLLADDDVAAPRPDARPPTLN